MCMMCNALVGARHWSDGVGIAHVRRDEQRRRLRLLGAILEHYGLTLKPWSGEGYLLAKDSGATELAGNLPGLWAAVERASNGHCDPLDPGLIAALSDAETAAR